MTDKNHAARIDILLLYLARGVRGFGDGFAIIILPAYYILHIQRIRTCLRLRLEDNCESCSQRAALPLCDLLFYFDGKRELPRASILAKARDFGGGMAQASSEGSSLRKKRRPQELNDRAMTKRRAELSPMGSAC